MLVVRNNPFRDVAHFANSTHKSADLGRSYEAPSCHEMLHIRKWLNRHRVTCSFVVVSIFWILSLVLLTDQTYKVQNEQVHQPTEVIADIPRINRKEFTDSTLLAVVILQLSAVISKNQLSRLKVIDGGWAQWTKFTPTMATENSNVDIKVIAPVSIFDSSMSLSTIELFHGVDNVVLTPTPFHRLVHSLLKAIDFRTDKSGNAKWMILANDHSFIIPQNLRRFLSLPALNPENILYSGNQLGLHYNKGLLYFASGGAGAVLSHVTAKFIVFMWMLLSDDPSLLKLVAPAESPKVSIVDRSSIVCLKDTVQLTAYSAQNSKYMWDVAYISTLLRAWIDEEPAQPSLVLQSLCDDKLKSDHQHTVSITKYCTKVIIVLPTSMFMCR